MVDVGCGIGGSSRHISRMFGCTAQGITLSPVQAARANELSAASGLGDKCRFQVIEGVLPGGGLVSLGEWTRGHLWPWQPSASCMLSSAA